MYKDVELRKLPAALLCSITDILEINYDWKKVMSNIPKDLQSSSCGSSFEAKYNNEHVRLIEEYSRETNRRCTEILFDEWSTSGRIRPTLGTLRDVVLKAEIFRAADEIAKILREPIPSRPERGPAAPIDINITNLLNNESMEEMLNSMESIRTDNFNTNSINGTHMHALCNGTTKQMKSASDFIKFSEVIPNISALQHDKQPASEIQTKKEKDLIEFSKSTLNSQYLPDFSALMVKSDVINDLTSQVSSMTVSTESDNDSSQVMPSPNHPVEQVSQPQYIPEVYQMSLPNIDLFSEIDIVILEDANLIQFEYKELKAMTNNFSEEVLNTPSGLTGKIGSGGFGEVFVGNHHKHGSLAVKKVRGYLQLECKPEVAMKLFNTEVKSLSLLRHNNIVPILGFSIDGTAPCIVCKYIDGGSLDQMLAAKILSETQRMGIMIGTAEGLKYIHNTVKPMNSGLAESCSQTSSKRTYFLHGDVKSANILLTKDCVPKLCDFGLVKQYNSTFITRSMMGTSAYMAPEGFSGTITQKNDIFSYGIVLLELLTGFKPIIMDSNGDINIKNYIEENCTDDNINSFIDPVVGEWPKAQRIYFVAKQCLKYLRNNRPTIDEVCEALNEINVDKTSNCGEQKNQPSNSVDFLMAITNENINVASAPPV